MVLGSAIADCKNFSKVILIEEHRDNKSKIRAGCSILQLIASLLGKIGKEN